MDEKFKKKEFQVYSVLETHRNRAHSGVDNNVGNLVLKLISAAYTQRLPITEQVPSGQLPVEERVHNTYQ